VTSGQASAIYVGQVAHVRLRPKRHALRYSVFMLLLDLDEGPQLARRLRWFSLGRFNLLSFHAGDHGDGSQTPLRQQVERMLDAADMSIGGGPIQLLCLPRMLGYAFNPLSVYFCHRTDGVLRAILYEVSSTFGERHSYLIPVAPDAPGPIRQTAQKLLHVSPFLDMALRYEFKVIAPTERLHVGIDAIDAEGPILTASFAGARRPLTDRDILSVWMTHPLLTLRVIAGIHWEAVKLALKGMRLRGGSPAPTMPVSLGAVCPVQTERR
jgi:DUF1365 family protein